MLWIYHCTRLIDDIWCAIHSIWHLIHNTQYAVYNQWTHSRSHRKRPVPMILTPLQFDLHCSIFRLNQQKNLRREKARRKLCKQERIWRRIFQDCSWVSNTNFTICVTCYTLCLLCIIHSLSRTLSLSLLQHHITVILAHIVTLTVS
jgi:hypothetical protein